jgi:hypothetical protein
MYEMGFYIPEDGILHSHFRGNLNRDEKEHSKYVAAIELSSIPDEVTDCFVSIRLILPAALWPRNRFKL